MEFTEVIENRFSCRGFLPDEVPQEHLEEMLELAQQTANGCNAQPWQVWLVRGEAAQEFGRRLTEHARAHPSVDEWREDIPQPRVYPGVYRDRRRSNGFGLYGVMGIKREDKQARFEAMLRNFNFFGAPTVAIITTEPGLGAFGIIDCGAYVTNLMNAATNLGIDTIAQAAIGNYAEKVHEILGIPSDRHIVCGVAIGYRDPEVPANSFRDGRVPVEEVVVRVNEISQLGDE